MVAKIEKYMGYPRLTKGKMLMMERNKVIMELYNREMQNPLSVQTAVLEYISGVMGMPVESVKTIIYRHKKSGGELSPFQKNHRKKVEGILTMYEELMASEDAVQERVFQQIADTYQMTPNQVKGVYYRERNKTL